MSSFVVWLELIRYVWKPERPTIDQTEKKHTTASSTLAGLSLSAFRNPVCCERRMTWVITNANIKTVRKDRDKINI